MQISLKKHWHIQVNLDMTDSMGPGKLVRHMQNPSYTYDKYLICMGLGPSILSVIDESPSYSGQSYPSSLVLTEIFRWKHYCLYEKHTFLEVFFMNSLRYTHPKHTIFAVFFRTTHLLKIFEEQSTYEAILFHILCEIILYSQMFFKCIVNQGVTLKEGTLGTKGSN